MFVQAPTCRRFFFAQQDNHPGAFGVSSASAYSLKNVAWDTAGRSRESINGPFRPENYACCGAVHYGCDGA
jgi:hypothetical protein